MQHEYLRPIEPSQDVFPFSAVVGQDDMKLALILSAIDPKLGGVLVRGEKGTAKSTTVRALAWLLPEEPCVMGCGFGCRLEGELCSSCYGKIEQGQALSEEMRRTPVVDLPLNATEDMLLGGLDFSRSVKSGQRHFMPGVLAKAHRGFLYVDEVNLLDDHLVDVLLDAAASGVNTVEREGISHSHPCSFTLVGTMNPEEGELRPQFLDRFGLCVEVAGESDLEARVKLMELREEFDRDRQSFMMDYSRQDKMQAGAIVAARQRISGVHLSQRLESFIVNLCLESCVAGLRADIILARAARAYAAYLGKAEVSEEDIAKVASMVLLHRRRDAVPPPPPPPPTPPEDQQQEEEPPESEEQESPPQPEEEENNQPPDEGESFDMPLPEEKPQQADSPEKNQSDEQIFEVGATFKVRSIKTEKDRKLRRGSGRRSATRTAQRQGRYVKSSIAGDQNDLALDATLRAAAPYQRGRPAAPGMAVNISRQDVRCKVREKRVGNFLMFLVDSSGSMGAKARMAATKGAIMSLLLDAYQKRDKVSLVSFRAREASLDLPPTSSIELAAKLLKELPVGGRTPLSAGLLKAHEELARHLRKEPESRPIVLVLTDGKANAAMEEGKKPLQEAHWLAMKAATDPRVQWIVVDTEPQGIVRMNLASRLADCLGAELFEIENLKARDLVTLAKRDAA